MKNYLLNHKAPIFCRDVTCNVSTEIINYNDSIPNSSGRAVDWTKTEIKLKQPANRIVCLTAAGLDILLELDMEPVGCLSTGVVAKPEFYGERAKNFVAVGSWMAPNLKAIRNAKPDLIIFINVKLFLATLKNTLLLSRCKNRFLAHNQYTHKLHEYMLSWGVLYI